MWRRVKSDLVAAHLEDGCQRVGARALSIGACHVNSAVVLMWMIEMIIQFQGVYKTFLIA